MRVDVWKGHASRLVSRHLVVAELVNPRIQRQSVRLLAPEHTGVFGVRLASSLLISAGSETTGFCLVRLLQFLL